MSAGSRLRDERGFTLVELLVTMSAAIVVLFAILGAADMFARSAVIGDRTTDAQDVARVTVRGMVHELRQGRRPGGQTSPIAPVTQSRTDLVVATWVPTTGGGEAAGWVRYCATGASPASLVMGTRIGDGYLAPGACSVADTSNGWQHQTIVDRRLQNPERLFDYWCAGVACATPNGADVQSVGIRVAIGTSPQATEQFNSVVRDAVSFRNRSTT